MGPACKNDRAGRGFGVRFIARATGPRERTFAGRNRLPGESERTRVFVSVAQGKRSFGPRIAGFFSETKQSAPDDRLSTWADCCPWGRQGGRLALGATGAASRAPGPCEFDFPAPRIGSAFDSSRKKRYTDGPSLSPLRRRCDWSAGAAWPAREYSLTQHCFAQPSRRMLVGGALRELLGRVTRIAANWSTWRAPCARTCSSAEPCFARGGVVKFVAKRAVENSRLGGATTALFTSPASFSGFTFSGFNSRAVDGRQ